MLQSLEHTVEVVHGEKQVIQTVKVYYVEKLKAMGIISSTKNTSKLPQRRYARACFRQHAQPSHNDYYSLRAVQFSLGVQHRTFALIKNIEAQSSIPLSTRLDFKHAVVVRCW